MYSKLGTVLLSAVLGVALLAVAPPPATSSATAVLKPKPAPAVTRLSVSTGPTAGGTTITISGRHLTKVTKVLFGTTPGRKVKSRSATSLRVTAPAHAAGLVHVRVYTLHGTSKAVSADRFRFTDWVRTGLPAPADAASAPDLRQSACWADQRCVALGAYRQKSGNDAAVLWTLTGRHRSGARAPVPADAAANPDPLPRQVACGAAGLCVAFAEYTAHVDGRDVGAELLWARSGGSWTVVAPPVPADADPGTGADIDGIACAGPICMARGYYEFNGGLRPAFWRLDDGTWTVASAPLPADAVRVDLGTIDGLACSGDGTCAATGLYRAEPGVGSGVLWRLTDSGSTATKAAPPAARAYAADLRNVGVCGPAVCLALFDLDLVVGGASTDFWTREGGDWTRTDLPLPAGAEAGTAYVWAMACPQSGECVAVGQYIDSDGDAQGGLWVRSAGGTWTATRAALPADAAQNPKAVARRVSCADDGTCVAAGAYVYHSSGSDIDQEASYDSLQWTYADGKWSVLRRLGFNRTADREPSLVSCGSDYCVRFDGAQTLWASGGGKWLTFSPRVPLAGLAAGGGVALGDSWPGAPQAWVYVG